MENSGANQLNSRADEGLRWRRASLLVLMILVFGYLYIVLIQFNTIFSDLVFFVIAFCSIFVFSVHLIVIWLRKLFWKKPFSFRHVQIVFLNVVLIFTPLFLLPQSRVVKFLMLKSVYYQMQADISRDDRNGTLEYYHKTDIPLEKIKFKKDYPFFPKDTEDFASVSFAIDGENRLIFFLNSGFLFEICGIMYSSKDEIPEMSFFDFDWGSRGGFTRLEKNWFHGCIRYD